jgi:hypothetical protein
MMPEQGYHLNGNQGFTQGHYSFQSGNEFPEERTVRRKPIVVGQGISSRARMVNQRSSQMGPMHQQSQSRFGHNSVNSL